VSPMSGAGPVSNPEWFAQADAPEGGRGLRFGCTMCGNCCSGPPGYVLVTPAEVAALAKRLGVSEKEFIDRYTHMMSKGRSLNEVVSRGAHPAIEGDVRNDCVFLDRVSVPGRGVCGVYEDRPGQCRTWPFWPSVVRSREAWDRATRVCPGMNTGRLVPVEEVRVLRDRVEI
jgi:Fe-S-cluster containining protein